MKKILSIALCLLLVFGLVACGNNDQPEEDNTTTEITTEATTEATTETTTETTTEATTAVTTTADTTTTAKQETDSAENAT